MDNTTISPFFKELLTSFHELLQVKCLVQQLSYMWSVDVSVSDSMMLDKGDTEKVRERRGLGSRGVSIHHLFHASAIKVVKGSEQQRQKEQVKQFHLL